MKKKEKIAIAWCCCKKVGGAPKICDKSKAPQINYLVFFLSLGKNFQHQFDLLESIFFQGSPIRCDSFLC